MTCLYARREVNMGRGEFWGGEIMQILIYKIIYICLQKDSHIILTEAHSVRLLACIVCNIKSLPQLVGELSEYFSCALLKVTEIAHISFYPQSQICIYLLYLISYSLDDYKCMCLIS